MADNLMDVPDADYSARQTSEYDQSRYTIAMRLLQRNVKLQGARIFDFGCGDGTLMRKLIQEGAVVSGCDGSTGLSEMAGVICGGASILEQQEPGIDVLIVLNVTSWMSKAEQNRLWKAIPQKLKPGGLFLHNVLNPNAGKDRRKFSADPRYFPIFLRCIGLKEIDRDFYGYYPMPWTRWWTGKPGRIFDLQKTDMVPKFIKAHRATHYFSLSKKV